MKKAALHALFGSLASNDLGVVYENGRWIAKAEGIIKLAEALLHTNIQKLKWDAHAKHGTPTSVSSR